MSLHLDLDQLLDYSDAERTKWADWVGADPSRLGLPFQNGGRFPTIGDVFDHIVLVEQRHLTRFEGGTPPDATGVAVGDWEALFAYAALARTGLRRYVTNTDDAAWSVVLAIPMPTGTFTMTRRKLAVHVVLHETRHLAQIAYAARLAGHEPPGAHDLFYSTEVR